MENFFGGCAFILLMVAPVMAVIAIRAQFGEVSSNKRLSAGFRVSAHAREDWLRSKHANVILGPSRPFAHSGIG
jgi:hypothetical protein